MAPSLSSCFQKGKESLLISFPSEKKVIDFFQLFLLKRKEYVKKYLLQTY
jgi:hypothetical protein